MSLVCRVPETSTLGESELDAGDANATLKRIGTKKLVTASFERFRYGDGFSHARALALQLVLAVFPLAIAVVGLTTVVHGEKFRQVLTDTLLAIIPGSSEEIVRQVLTQAQQQAGRGGATALLAGAVAALVSLTTAMGQVERAANRIYGIERDRPTSKKYVRAFLLAFAAGIPVLAGFVVLLAGGPLGDAAARVYGWGGGAELAYDILRWPVGIGLDLLAITVLFRYAPRRRQPGMTWLGMGAALSLVLWLVFTALLALYVGASGSVSATYGPLTGVIALVLWANLSAIALLLGLSVAAQLEAARAGVTEGAPDDPEPAVAAR